MCTINLTLTTIATPGSIDGEPPGDSHGVDTDADGRGVLGGGRMYQLVRAHAGVGPRTLEILFTSPAPRRTASRSASA